MIIEKIQVLEILYEASDIHMLSGLSMMVAKNWIKGCHYELHGLFLS